MEFSMRLLASLAALAASVSLVVACGGGGSGGGGGAAVEVIEKDKFSINGRVIDGYLVNAHVFIDLNGNFRHDQGEPSTFTDLNGQYFFSGLSFNPSNYNIVSEIIAGQTIDLDNPNLAIEDSYLMSAPKGIYNITPITTLIQSKVINGFNLIQSVDLIANKFNVSGLDLLDDFVFKKIEDPAYSTLHNIAASLIPSFQTFYRDESNEIDRQAYFESILLDFTENLQPYIEFIKISESPTQASILANFITNPDQTLPSCNQYDPIDLYISTNLDLYKDTNNKSIRTQTEIFLNTTDGRKLNGTISGRGNSTWGMPKKPYRLRIDNDLDFQHINDVLGMPKNRHWVLLANYADKTLLRTKVAFCLSQILSIDWTPQSRFVNLFSNSDQYEYQGLYQLVEHVRVDTNRVNLGERIQDRFAFFIELDARYLSEDYWFVSSMGQPFVFKYNDDTGSRRAKAREDTENFINNFESILSNGSFSDLIEIVDIDSVVNLYLINELSRNNDFMWSSSFFYKPYDSDKIHFGPAWDFDISFGNINYNGNENTEGFWVKNTRYYQYFFKHPEFRDLVLERFLSLEEKLDLLDAWIVAYAVKLEDYQSENFKLWDILNSYVWPNSDIRGTYFAEVSFLRNWIASRRVWLSGEFYNLTLAE